MMTGKIFFFHNPKAGGYSLRRMFESHFRPEKQCPIIENDTVGHEQWRGEYAHLPNDTTLHILNLAGFPLLGLAAYLLVKDVNNAAATLANLPTGPLAMACFLGAALYLEFVMPKQRNSGIDSFPEQITFEFSINRPTGHNQIREADAAHATSTLFLYTICGRCISNSESK
jgi:hypothetical protein